MPAGHRPPSLACRHACILRDKAVLLCVDSPANPFIRMEPTPSSQETIGLTAASEGDVASVPASVRLGCLLAWIGIWLCLLLLNPEAGWASAICPRFEDCSQILHSRYAAVAGISLAWFGLAFYGLVLSLWLGIFLAPSRAARRRMSQGLLWLTCAGLAFSMGLMYLQFVVIRGFCPLCTASAVLVASLVGAAWRAGQALEGRPFSSARGEAAFLIVFALVPVVAGAPVGRGANPPAQWQIVDSSIGHRNGSATAPLQVVVYSDFECGYCRQLAQVLQRLYREFPDKVAVNYRHFPLSNHPRSFAAAVAAECAAEQGAFWTYHDRLFSEGGDLSDPQLLRLAVSTGLDRQRFQMCLQSEAPRKAVEASRREAIGLKLPGTPFLFLNGREFRGPHTHDGLVREMEAAVRLSVGSNPASH